MVDDITAPPIERPSLMRLGTLFLIALTVFVTLIAGAVCELSLATIAILLATLTFFKVWAQRTRHVRTSGALNPVIAGLCLLFVMVFITPNLGSRESGHLTICLNNLRILGAALRDYHQAHGALPPVYTTDENGKPLCSWRVAILPYLERNDLYSQYQLQEQWDGQHNAKVAKQPVEFFQCPSNLSHESCDTSYVAVIGPGTAWEPNRGLKLSDITDDPRDTILLVEMKDTGIKWAEPRDLGLSNLPPGITTDDLLQSLSIHPGLVQALFADGHVEVIRSEMPWSDFEAMLTIAGSERINRDKW